MNERLLAGARDGDRLELAAAGAWTAEHAGELESLIAGLPRGEGDARALTVDASGIERLDTFGAWLLERLVREWSQGGREARLVGMSEQHAGLSAAVGRVNRAAVSPPSHVNRLTDALAAVGRNMAGLGNDLLCFTQMLGEIAGAVARVIVRPRAFRLTSVVHQLDRVGWQAVPIIMLITFLIGAIIAQQGIFHFRKFGADTYVVDMVGILVLREIGVLLVAIMVAGRSGSAYTAELGAMKMREEIDALRTMGFDPVEVLILPRVVALVIAVPILAFLGSMAALYGGLLVCWFYGGISPDVYLARLREAVTLNTFEVGMYKAPFMALVIGIIACVEGLQVRGSAESLGSRTTASVVKAIFLVIVLDGLFAVFFAAIGK